MYTHIHTGNDMCSQHPQPTTHCTNPNHKFCGIGCIMNTPPPSRTHVYTPLLSFPLSGPQPTAGFAKLQCGQHLSQRPCGAVASWETAATMRRAHNLANTGADI